MYKACSRCGRIHDEARMCPIIRVYRGGEERKLRNKYSWAKKSREIRERASYLCEVCKDHGIYTYNDVEVHHLYKLKDHPEKLLEDDNLICLCQEHHKQADKGKLSMEYLRSLVDKREEKYPRG